MTKTQKKRIKNLKQWKPGQSGNPKGRPLSSLSETSILKKMMGWEAPEKIADEYKRLFPQLPKKPTCLEIAVARNIMKALDRKTGDVMAEKIWERLDGKLRQPIGGEDNEPIPVTIYLPDNRRK